MSFIQLDAAKDFYGNVLGCKEGRSSEKWQDYSLHGHQIVCHWVGKSAFVFFYQFVFICTNRSYVHHQTSYNAHLSGDDYRCIDYFNPVDGDEVPVPHAGLALTVGQFHALAERVRKAGVEFIIKPHLRFKGAPGEQW